jgi:hypothetical protein
MSGFLLQGKILKIVKNGVGYTVILSGDQKITLSDINMLDVLFKVTGKKVKGGNLDGVIERGLEGKTLSLIVE